MMFLVFLLAMACDRSAPPPRDAAEREIGATPKQQTRPGPWKRPCADLPETRPADFVLRYELHDYERPEDLVRVDAVAVGHTCPPDEMPGHLLRIFSRRDCLLLDAAEMDRLYAILRRHRVDTIRTRTLPMHPHHGGSAIGLSHSGTKCRLEDITNSVEVAPEDRERYRAAAGAIHDAFHAAQQKARAQPNPPAAP